MAMKITEVCANCGPCEQICPNDAIYPGDGQFFIDPEKCTECVGWFDEPQCVDACPVDSVVPDPDHVETREQLQAKFERLQKANGPHDDN